MTYSTQILGLLWDIQRIFREFSRIFGDAHDMTLVLDTPDDVVDAPDAKPLKVERGEIDKLMASKSIYKCMSCMACIERCPRQVEPAKLVEAIRLAVIRKQGQNHLIPDDVPAKLDPDLPQQALVSAFRKYTK